MDVKKLLPTLLLIVLAVITVSVKNCRQTTTQKPTTHITNVDPTTTNTDALNRNPAKIHYSKHAKCRMSCRHIDENEVKDILKNGTINYQKSELEGDTCHKKYAVEGYSKDNQHLRIIFAPCGDEETVVTCIDLGVEWSCNCE